MGFRPMARGRLLCPVDEAMAEESGAGIGAALALGEQDEVELDHRKEEPREQPTILVTKILRGPSAEELASHLLRMYPSELGVHRASRLWSQHRHTGSRPCCACGRSGLRPSGLQESRVEGGT